MLILLPSRIAFGIVELKKWKLTESKGQPHIKQNQIKKSLVPEPQAVKKARPNVSQSDGKSRTKFWNKGRRNIRITAKGLNTPGWNNSY